MSNSKVLGYVAYEGPSLFDGRPIAVIINRLDGSDNAKTGAIVQSFIIRTDINPVGAIKTGKDKSVCGDCIHRPLLAKKTGAAPCYVQVGKSVLSVYRAYRRGRYVRATPEQIGALLAGKVLRIGTYGDPAMAPVEVWQRLVVHVAGHRGYSHQWQQPWFDHASWSSLVMASVDSVAERDDAKALGMRTFRVSLGVSKKPKEATCPASAEGGRRITCADCVLCSGTKIVANDVVIADHAVGFKNRVFFKVA